jgi:hypothetical protein
MGKSVIPEWKFRGVQVHWGQMGNDIAPNMVVNVSAIEKDTGAIRGKVILKYHLVCRQVALITPC